MGNLRHRIPRLEESSHGCPSRSVARIPVVLISALLERNVLRFLHRAAAKLVCGSDEEEFHAVHVTERQD